MLYQSSEMLRLKAEVDPVKEDDVASNCIECGKGAEEVHCQYWLHKIKVKGNAVSSECLCDKHVYIAQLYDGRKEYVCFRCEKIIQVFLAVPEFLKLCQLFYEYADRDMFAFGSTLWSVRQESNSQIVEIGRILVDFQKLSVQEVIAQLKPINFDEVIKSMDDFLELYGDNSSD